ncbi:polysaccharide deacetylase family protein [Actinomadura keratinilytica]
MSTNDPATTTPSWQWPETTWRRHVHAVRAGRPLRPERWPDGARAAVALSFDSDHETIPLRDGQTSPGLLAQGEYGARVGAPRVLELLARFGVPATFFMPAVSALLHPEEARAYTRDNHEIAVHGWIHERNTLLTADDEKELVRRALETLTEITGSGPPASAPRPGTSPTRPCEPSSTSASPTTPHSWPTTSLRDPRRGQAHRTRGDPGRLDPRRRALLHHGPLRRRPPAQPPPGRAGDLAGRVRRGLPLRRRLPAHPPPARHRPPLAPDRPARTARPHLRPPRRLVRHPRGTGPDRPDRPRRPRDPGAHRMSTEPRTAPAPGPAHKLTGKQRKAIVAGTIGNTVEWVDWALYSIFAKIIADEFFPSGNEAVALLSTLAVFAVGFVMRPVGAAVLGVYADRHGRKKGMTLTVGLMAERRLRHRPDPQLRHHRRRRPAGAAPRPAGPGLLRRGEFGSSSAFLVESAARGRRAFAGSWQQVSVAAAS